KIGSPYHFGYKGPSEFDCSGLMMWAYAQAGYQLGPDTYAQLNDGTPVASVSDLRVGDLVFFNGGEHVGMWAGNGIILHAPHTGAVVRFESITTIGTIYAMRHI
ncbi:C40 family peptidase, partial [Streptacidiphilus melanogenes]|uniref:C40 family peptidase n=1 Tax=Streptacidiphilus melanogenes TaxID=411235 RepID=UPI0005AB1F2E